MDSTVVYSVTRIHQFNGNCRNINENIRRQASSDRSVLHFLTQTELMASFSFSLDQLPQREWNHVHACQLFFCFFWFSQNLSFSNSRLTLGLRNFSEVGGNVHVLWLSKHCAGHGVVRARGGGGTQDYECIIHCSYFFRSLLFACEKLYDCWLWSVPAW